MTPFIPITITIVSILLPIIIMWMSSLLSRTEIPVRIMVVPPLLPEIPVPLPMPFVTILIHLLLRQHVLSHLIQEVDVNELSGSYQWITSCIEIVPGVLILVSALQIDALLEQGDALHEFHRIGHGNLVLEGYEGVSQLLARFVSAQFDPFEWSGLKE